MAQNNPQQHFMMLYEPVHYRFERFCRTKTKTDEHAKDLLAETVLTAYERLAFLCDDKAFLHYLFGIAFRILQKQYRRSKYWGLFNDNEAIQMSDHTNDPERDMDINLLYQALAKLPVKYQEAVVLFEISGFSMQEVADIQRCSLSAVKVRVMRGRNELCRLLGAEKDSLEKQRRPSLQQLLFF